MTPPATVVRSSPTDLSEAARQQALARFRVLRPHLEDGVPLVRIAQTAAVPLRTLHRWRHAYRHAGLVGLARKPRADRDYPHLPPALIALIEGLALRTPRASAAAIHRQVATVARDQGWPTPAYSTVTAIVRSLDPALRTLAHEGTTAYMNTFDLIHRRTASHPNEVWQADHTPLALWVRDHRGRAARPWLTVIMDDYSRAIAGYALNLAGASAAPSTIASGTHWGGNTGTWITLRWITSHPHGPAGRRRRVPSRRRPVGPCAPCQ